MSDTTPPALYAAPNSITSTPDVPNNITDTDTIGHTVGMVDQKAGATTDAKPGLEQAPTMVTAVDGKLMTQNISDSNSTDMPQGAGRRASSDYYMVFNGTATNDAAIVGTAYLTFTVVSNSSYAQGLEECFIFCDKTDGCGAFESSFLGFPVDFGCSVP